MDYCISKFHSQYHTIGCLVKAFKLSNYPVSASWIRRQAAKGNIQFMHSTTDFKKSRGYNSTRILAPVRLITDSQIKGIIKAFLPDGKGYFKKGGE